MLKDIITTMRQTKKLTKRQLAVKAGVSYETIQKIEDGSNKNVGLETLNKIAHGLDTNIRKLVPDDMEISKS